MPARICPYLVMNGNAAEAVRFYEKALGAEVAGVVNFGQMPEDPGHPLPAEAKDRVAHAHLKIGGTDLMLSDTFPGQPHSSGNQVNVMFLADTPATARRVFDALSDGGKVLMPLAQTHWSPAYGMLIDRFGVSFQISTDQ
ncbi:MAG TPA: VOC family protein [Symbiobacteriaceae bacterium]|nr:VOC family protein [Symbiobacteriaceae bacterium]